MTGPLSLPHRAWRRLPAGPRRAALRAITALLAPRPDRPPPPVGPGMALLGEFARPSGLGMGVRLVRAALDAMGMPTIAIDTDAPRAPLPPAGMPLILHVNPPMLPLALLRQPRALLRGRRVIGMWNWELPEMPPDWRIGLRHVHEVWVTSHFTAAAMAKLLPQDGSIPLRVVSYPLAIAPPAPAPIDRAGFGLPPDALLVLVSFNLASSFVRKNPLAAIDAFRSAFADRADRLLLLKIGHADHFPDDLAEIRRHIGTAPNIRVETRPMSTAETHALTACADLVLSLHRAEGFGLVPAEAMLLGRPVVCTGWSGNMDFMDEHSAALVPYRLVPAQDPRGVLDVPGAVWAEPDTKAAAALLRTLADDPAARAALAARGQAHARAALSDASLRAALAGLAG